jgi:deferrochelatase/peroxidase EfeB
MGEEATRLELEDIQSGILRARPAPYAAAYLIFRIDDRKAGRELMRRAGTVIASATHPNSPIGDAWATVALTFQGLRALGVSQDSLVSFSPEFQQGMAARAAELGDTGESSPENWENPLGTPDVHVVLAALAPDAQRLGGVLDRARQSYEKLSGVELIWRQDCYALPNEKEPLGYKDGISHPAIKGSGIPGSNPHEGPFKVGEFVLGYRDETGGFPPMPQPEVLGRNGTSAVVRKLYHRVAALRLYLRANSSSPQEEELLAAKMMGAGAAAHP